MQIIDLAGIWECEIPGQRGSVCLPGTLDEGGFGGPDDPHRQWKAEELRARGLWQEGDPILTRLTRKKSWEGEAVFTRRIRWQAPVEGRIFLECERTRQLRAVVNGREVFPAGASDTVSGGSGTCTLSAPCVFDVTGLVTGEDEITLISDNSYPGWPRGAIVYSSAATDETQTNWNGILGYVRLRIEKPDFISGIRVYPRGDQAEIRIELDLSGPREGEVRISSPALREELTIPFRSEAGICCLRGTALLGPWARRWDLGEGNLYTLTAEADGMESRSTVFGIRDFRAAKGHLTLNGRRIFLRGETNCAVYPETGYIPTDTARWRDILKGYRQYGVNCVRFHSHCPPEAAFTAADEAGILLQPELSHWDPENAFGTDEARRYYGEETRQILRHLANHPSFVMLSFGNELQYGGEGRQFAERLLQAAREEDPTRLYTDGSNAFYGAKGPNPAADFYTSSDDRGRMLRATSAEFRGWLNEENANARRDYSAAMAALRQDSAQPVFSFEVGQYEVLPDFGEIREYQGVTVPGNLIRMEERMREAGLEKDWARMVEATGENALQCYRAEVEAAMRTEAFSGISLLSLQDFPGQGTALIGMMNAHMRPKPYDFAKPERFAAFFRDVLPMALLPRYVFTYGDEVCVPVRIANYGKADLTGKVHWTLENPAGTVQAGGAAGELCSRAGGLSDAGEIRILFSPAGEPAGCDRDFGQLAEKLTLRLDFCGNLNEYPLWVYPDLTPVCPEDIYECRTLDDRALSVLSSGGKVFLAPESTAEAISRSVQAQFSPDFWSVNTFPTQSGCMGQLIDTGHPLFRNFPTETFSSWQWHPMAGTRAMLLPRRMKTIIAEMDSGILLRPMAQLFECRCGGGRLMVSSMGLRDLAQAPNVRALRQAVYDYMSSEAFVPEEEMGIEEIQAIMHGAS